jgi:hypothetical protein
MKNDLSFGLCKKMKFGAKISLFMSTTQKYWVFSKYVFLVEGAYLKTELNFFDSNPDCVDHHPTRGASQ